jgi:serine/threonine-protein kinase
VNAVAAEPEEEVPPAEASTDHDERIGLVVAERYRIARVLGVGGMGGVYEAEHLLIGKKVALKCLHREYARDRDIVERFKREARAATLIGNDHIIDVTDMGDLPDGSPFLVMEFLAGSPLASLCERPMPVRRTVHIARQICSALGAAHDKGIIHRDLKPENVFLVERNGDPDFVKVLDFGISKMHSSGVDKGLTRTGMAMGTPSYMSPEQAQGSKNLDHRTDVWALGVILYEMLASRRPFDADSYPLLLMNIVATDPDPIGWYRKDLPPAFADVVMRCLAKAPDARIGSMRDLSEALAPFAGFDIEVEIGEPQRDGGERQSVTERYKQTALGRKKTTSTPDASADERRSGSTQPDGSIEGPPPVSFAEAEAQARALERTSGGRERGRGDDVATRAASPAVPSPPAPDAATSSAIAPPSPRPAAHTAPEVRAFERQAQGGPQTRIAAGLGLAALLGLGVAAASGAFSSPPTTASAPPLTSEPPSRVPPPTAATPPPTTPAPTTPPAPPAEVRIRIRAEPSDARILIGGIEFPNPMDAPQLRSLTPTRITIEREGYTTIEQLAIFGEDQSFMFQMARGRGVEQRGLGSGGGSAAGGSAAGAGGAPALGMETRTSMEVYQGMQGDFREEW